MTLCIVVFMLVAVASAATAQPADLPAPRLRPETLGFTYDETFLNDLPLADSVYPILESIQPSLISDRFTGGGLFTGRPARVGGFQASWSQTRFLLGDVDISDPNGSGIPLLFPDLAPWGRIRVSTGLIGSDVNSTGLAITLDPRAPTTTRQHTGYASFSHGGRDRLAWTGSGPLTATLGGAFAATWTRTSQYDRADPIASDAGIGSAFASLVHTQASGATLHTIGWAQRAQTPSDNRHAFAAPEARTRDTAGHLQSTWQAAAGTRWRPRLFAAYTQRTRTPDAGATTAVVERMIDGPVWAAVSGPRGTVRQWTIGARTQAAPSWRGAAHAFTTGVDLVGASQHTPVATTRIVGELTDGLPSRVWSFRNPTSPSSRRSFSVNLYASDTVQISRRLTASAGLRVEALSGSADGATNGIGWTSLLPRARLDWRLRDRGTTTAFVGYTRSASRLALDLLAFGDPNAPWATVYRWDPRFATPVAGVTSVVARTGPGAAGSADFVTIDPDLQRPTSDELSFGFEMQPSARARWQIAAVGRREHGFMTLLNPGAPTTAYTRSTVTDPGANTGSPEDDKIIPIYDRLPASFGNDRYVLTNPGLKASYSGSLEISGQYSAARLTFYGGATASIARGPAAALGYGPLENDQSVVSETYISPNADPFRRGRLFNDRAFTIKLSAAYRLPWDLRAGAIARYQDGQNFSRVLVFPTLAQGTEAVRAFAAGDSRFRFIAALDVRLSKGFTVGGRRVEGILDGYNLTGLRYDVEERAAQAPNDRTPIAIQPSRVFHVGVRVGL